MSAGWGRSQGEGTGPDWLAPEDDEEPEGRAGSASGWAGASAPAAPQGWASDGAPEQPAGWSAWAEPPSASATRRTAPGPQPSASESPGEEPPAWLDEPGDEPDEEPHVPHRSFAKPERQPKSGAARTSGAGRSGFGEGGRGGSRSGANARTGGSRASGSRMGAGGGSGRSQAARSADKPAWQSRRKDRDRNADPGAEPAEKKPQSREKLEQRARNILLYHLARQMQTRAQLADRLRKKEIPDDIAEAVLDRFEDLHLLDDATYAETFVRSRHQERGLAKRALGYELHKRGVDNDTAEEALATLDEDQEAETARRLVEGRLRATRNLDQQVRVRRLVGMLARKGYSSSVALRAVKEALAEEGERLDAELDPAVSDAFDDTLDDAGLE